MDRRHHITPDLGGRAVFKLLAENSLQTLATSTAQRPVDLM